MGVSSTAFSRGLTARHNVLSGFVLASAYTGQIVQATTGSGTFGAFVQLHAGAATDYYLTSMVINPQSVGGAHHFSVRIGLGAGGAESTVAEFPFLSASQAGYDTLVHQLVPIRVPASTRLAVAVAAATGGWAVAFSASGTYAAALES